MFSFRSWLKHLQQKFTSKKAEGRKAKRKPPRAMPLQVELLEDRLVPATTLNLNAGGILQIVVSQGDTAVLSNSGNQLQVNDSTNTITANAAAVSTLGFGAGPANTLTSSDGANFFNDVSHITQIEITANTGGGTVQIASVSPAVFNSSWNVGVDNSGGAAGTFDIHGVNETIANLTGSGTVTDTAGTATLTVTTSGSDAFPGTIAGTTAITIGGTGVLTLSGTKSYTGTTTINAGATLQVTTAALPVTNGVVDNGTWDLDGLGESIANFSGTSSSAVVGDSSSVNAALTTTLTAAQTFAGDIEASYNGGTGIVSVTVAGNTLALTGSNTYTGATTINSGAALQLGNNTATGSLSTGTISDAGSLIFDTTANGTASNLISGTGTVIQENTGTITLTGANTYTGVTTISAGDALQIGTGGVLGASNVTDNGTLIFNTTAATSIAHVISGSGGLVQENTGIVTLGTGATYTGPTTISSGDTLKLGVATPLSSSTAVTDNGTLDLDGNSASIGSLSGSGVVTSSAAGTLTLTVNGGGSFSGAIQAGTATTMNLVVAGTSQLLNLSGSLGSGVGTAASWTISSSDTLQLGSTAAIPSAATTVLTDNGTLDIDGLSPTIGSLSGTGSVTNTAASAPGTLTVTASSSFGGNFLAGNSPVGLTVGGTTTTLTLTNAVTNTNTGLTTINSGNTLKVTVANATSPSSAVNLAAGTSTLDLDGTINSIGSLSGSGTVYNSSGTAATLVVTGGGSYNGSFAAGSSSTALTVAGNNQTLVLTSNTNNTTNTGLVTIGNTDTLQIGSAVTNGNSSIPFNSTVNVLGTFDLNGNSPEIASLTGASNVVGNTTYAGTVTTSASGSNVTLTVASASVSSTFSGVIQNGSGTLNLLKLGSNTQTLAGANTYTGTTTISGGTLQIGNGGTTGSLATGTSISGTGTLAYNLAGNATVSNSLSGSLGLNQNGSGTLTLLGSCGYSGQTTVSAGTLQFGNGTTNPAALPGGTLQVAASVFLAFNLNSGGSPYTIGNTISGGGNLVQAGGGSTVVLTNSNPGFTGTMLIDSTATLQLNTLPSNITFPSVLDSGTLTVNTTGNYYGTIAGPGAVNFTGSGTVTLTTSSGGNTYSGATTIGSSTTLQIGSGAGQGIVNYTSPNSSVTVNAGGTLDLYGNSTAIDGLNGSGTVTSSQAGPINSSIPADPATLTVGSNNGSGTFSGMMTDGFTAPLSNPDILLNLIKVGTGTETVTSSLTYSGATTVNGGTLALSGTNGALQNTGSSIFSPYAALTLNQGGTLLLDNTAANNNARIPATAPLYLNGGTLQINGTSNPSTPTAQSVGGSTGVVLGAGHSSIILNPKGGNGLSLSVDGTMGSATLTRSPGSGGVLNVSDNGTSTLGYTTLLTFDTEPTMVGASGSNSQGHINLPILPYVTVNGSELATYNLSNGIEAYTPAGGTYVTPVGGFLTGTTNDNVQVTTSAAVNSSMTINSLSLSGTNTTLTIATGQTLTVASGALFTSSGAVTINGGGTLALGLVGINDPIIKTSSGATLTLGSGIALTAANLTLGGGGTVVLPGANSGVTGTTVLAGSTLNLGNSAALGTSTLNLVSGAIETSSTSGLMLSNALTFTNSNVTLTGSNPLVFTGTVSLPLVSTAIYNFTANNVYQAAANNTLTVTNTAATVLDGPITGSSNLTLGSATTGTLTLAANNSSFTGQVFVTAGALQVQNSNALGSGGVFVSSGAAVQLLGSSLSISTPLTLEGGAVLHNLAGSTGNNWTGNIILIGNGTSANTVISDPNTTLTLSGTIGGAIGCLGDLIKAGAGTVTLSGTNTLPVSGNTSWLGNTFVNGGVLNVTTPTALGSTAGSVLVNGYATQTLDFTGSPTGGTFTLSYNGGSARTVTYSPTFSTLQTNIQNALNGMGGLTGNFTVSGTATAVTIAFQGSLATTLTVPVGQLTVSSSGLSAASGTPSVSVSSGASLELSSVTVAGKSLTLAGQGFGYMANTALPLGALTIVSGTTDNWAGNVTLIGAGAGAPVIGVAGGAGTLTIGSTSSTAAPVGIVSGADLAVSGNAATASLYLAGANTFTGAVTVNCGTLTLSNSNAYSGATSVNGAFITGTTNSFTGGTLVLASPAAGVNGTALNSSSFTVNALSQLEINNTAANVTDDGVTGLGRLGNSAPITLNSGTLSFYANNGTNTPSSQTVGTITLGSGQSTILAGPSASNGTGATSLLSSAALVRNPGATVIFGNTVVTGTPPARRLDGQPGGLQLGPAGRQRHHPLRAALRSQRRQRLGDGRHHADLQRHADRGHLHAGVQWRQQRSDLLQLHLQHAGQQHHHGPGWHQRAVGQLRRQRHGVRGNDRLPGDAGRDTGQRRGGDRQRPQRRQQPERGHHQHRRRRRGPGEHGLHYPGNHQSGAGGIGGPKCPADQRGYDVADRQRDHQLAPADRRHPEPERLHPHHQRHRHRPGPDPGFRKHQRRRGGHHREYRNDGWAGVRRVERGGRPDHRHRWLRRFERPDHQQRGERREPDVESRHLSVQQHGRPDHSEQRQHLHGQHHRRRHERRPGHGHERRQPEHRHGDDVRRRPDQLRRRHRRQHPEPRWPGHLQFRLREFTADGRRDAQRQRGQRGVGRDHRGGRHRHAGRQRDAEPGRQQQ